MNKILMPAGGQTTNESLIAKWHKQVGDKIERGDVLFDIETDKATLEVESYCEGYLRATMFSDGDTASTGAVVAYIGNLDEEIPNENEEIPAISFDETEDEYQPISHRSKNEEPIAASEETRDIDVSFDRILSSPLAKKMAKENNVKLSDIHRFQNGIIKSRDIVDYLSETKEENQEFYDIPVSTMRQVIARRMCESVYTAPHYNVSIEIEMTSCIRMRKSINDYLNGNIRISFNDILALCVAKAIEKVPMINSSYSNQAIRIYKNVHIGLAVGIDGGLVVPVVKNANLKTLIQIAKENKENVKKAKEGKLASKEMSGGTITISNLGMLGVNHFTAVINQPESCILAVGSIIEKAVISNHEIVVRDMMNITASFDHRVIDGAVGALFLKEVKTLMEKPELILAY